VGDAARVLNRDRIPPSADCWRSAGRLSGDSSRADAPDGLRQVIGEDGRRGDEPQVSMKGAVGFGRALPRTRRQNSSVLRAARVLDLVGSVAGGQVWYSPVSSAA